MLTKIKLFAAAAAGMVMAVLYALLQREKAQRADEHAQIAEHTAKKAQTTAAAMVDGLEREEKIKHEKIDTNQPRDHFR